MADASFSEATSLIEKTLTSWGIDGASARVDGSDDAAPSWAFQRGSARVVVGLRTDERTGRSWLRVAAPVLIPPEDESTKNDLFRHVLELNAKGLGGACFGVQSGRIIALAERPTEGLDAGELEQILKQTSAVADTYDDRLQAGFGGKRAADADA